MLFFFIYKVVTMSDITDSITGKQYSPELVNLLSKQQELEAKRHELEAKLHLHYSEMDKLEAELIKNGYLGVAPGVMCW
jgi:hypothetical protein